jgi:hypothetical protein
MTSMRSRFRRPIAAFIAAAIAVAGGGIYTATQGGDGRSALTANAWVDTTGGTCAYSAMPVEYSDAAACGSLDAAWDTLSTGDTARIVAGTYGPQNVTGDKAGPTFLIGESKATVKFESTDECIAVFGAEAVFCAQAAFMHLENATLDAQDTLNIASAARIWDGSECGGCSAHHVKFKNVDLWGDYPNLYIQAPDFTWQGGSQGRDGVTPPPLCGGGGEPIWIEASADRATIDGVRHNPKVNGPFDPETCAPHVETVRIQDAPDGVVIKNNWFVAGSDAGSGHIFTGGGGGATNVKIINNLFEPVIGSFGCQCSNGAGWVMAYNTFLQAFSVGNTATWIGNLGVSDTTGCSGTHVRNVWQGTGSCGTDTYIGASSLGLDATSHLQAASPAIDAGETPGASDHCTDAATVASLDRDGDTRPAGSVCDAGADERVP